MKNGEAKRRARYLKELEKFLRRTLAVLSDYVNSSDRVGSLPDGSRNGLGGGSRGGSQKIRESIIDGGAKLDLIAKPDIFNPYFAQMDKIAEDLRAKAVNSDEGIDEVFSWFARSLNALEKSRREKSYSRQKTRKLVYGEWE